MVNMMVVNLMGMWENVALKKMGIRMKSLILKKMGIAGQMVVPNSMVDVAPEHGLGVSHTLDIAPQM